MGDVEHAHSAPIDVDVFDCRGWLGYGIRLDVLGDRANDVPATPDAETTSQGRSPRLAVPAPCCAWPAGPGLSVDVQYSQFSEKLRLFFDASLDGRLPRCGSVHGTRMRLTKNLRGWKALRCRLKRMVVR